MPRSLSPIPVGAQITDGHGIISLFYRLLWQALVDSFQISPTVAALDSTGLSAALITTTLYLALTGGMFRVNTTLTRTIDDGAASAGTITIGFTQGGVAKTVVLAPLTEAAGLSFQGVTVPVYADANTAITVAMAYASTTPAAAHFDFHATAEALG